MTRESHVVATVTLNPAVDRTMVVRGFAVGKTNRAVVEAVDAGGKGINVAKVLKQFGLPVTALGLLAGRNGRFIADTLAARGIGYDFVDVAGETRVNLKVKDPETGSETEINEPGFEVPASALEALAGVVERHARTAGAVIFSGSLPPGVPANIYASLIRLARKCGARTILDTSGEALRHGVAAEPDLVKPNRHEAEEMLGSAIGGEEDLPAAARRLLALGPQSAAISLGAAGALAASLDEAWRAYPPRIAPASTIGAGDAMIAALACGFVRRLSFADSFRLAMAAAAASASTRGTGTDLGSLEQLTSGVILNRL